MAPTASDMDLQVMSSGSALDDPAILLRFRDMVTELGGTLAEHQRLLRQRGYVWWGWWSRQSEGVPKATFADLFNEGRSVSVGLFDSGMLSLYKTVADAIAVAPSVVGIQSPEMEATPDYYFRGHYPVWFRLTSDFVKVDTDEITIVSRPTLAGFEVESSSGEAEETVRLDSLRDERPTLWLARLP